MDKGEIIFGVLGRFSEEKVNYCILRNYEDLEKEKDIDILISKKDRLRVKVIMEKFGLKKGIDFGHYLSYKNGRVWFDIRVGGIVYQGLQHISSKKILRRKRKYKGLNILSKEDEIVHLVLHSIIDKKNYKELYKAHISKLLNLARLDYLGKIFEYRLGDIGAKVYGDILKGDYESTLPYRNRIMMKLFRIRDFPEYVLLKLVKILR